MDRLLLKQTIQSNEKILDEIKNVLDVPKTKSRIEELSTLTLKDDFWLNQKEAKEVIDEQKDLKEKLAILDRLYYLEDTLKTIYDLSEDDIDMLDEVEKHIQEFDELTENLQNELLLDLKEDKLGAIVEIHSGAGGTESLDFVQMLYRMYQMYAQKEKMKIKVLNYEAGFEVGIKSVTFEIDKKYAYGMLKSESGVHRLIRLSPFDSSHSRHTTFASVLVTPLVTDEIEINLKDEDLRIDIFHSSGAGGQSVNTSFSAVRVTHIPTGIVVTCQNERSQIQNKQEALAVLKSRLYQLELNKREEERLSKLNKPQISFGSQIRTYVFHPYQMVKDHRTNAETSQAQKVMDGDINMFIREYLKMLKRDK